MTRSGDEIILEAGAHAFGDANHPTTALMLAALEGLAEQWQPENLCDMGCGSGILALRAQQLWPDLRIVAADMEKSAVETTARNAEVNGVILKLVHSDGFNHPDIRAQGPYDVILMNILAEPILRLLPDANALLAEGGVLMLSGMLVWQQEPIIVAAGELGLELGHRFQQGDWVAHFWQK